LKFLGVNEIRLVSADGNFAKGPHLIMMIPLPWLSAKKAFPQGAKGDKTCHPPLSPAEELAAAASFLYIVDNSQIYQMKIRNNETPFIPSLRPLR